MAEDINLLPREERATRAEITRRRLIVVGSLVALGVYGALVFFILSSAAYLTLRARSLSGQIEKATGQLATLSAKETLVVSLKSRMEGAVLVMNNQHNFRDWINDLEVLAPSGVDLGEIGLDNEGKLKVSGTAANSTLLSQFVDRLSGADAGYAKVTFSNITRDENPALEFALELDLIETGELGAPEASQELSQL